MRKLKYIVRSDCSCFYPSYRFLAKAAKTEYSDFLYIPEQHNYFDYIEKYLGIILIIEDKIKKI